MNKADIVKAQKQVLEVYETRLRSARIAQNAETVKEIKALLKRKKLLLFLKQMIYKRLVISSQKNLHNIQRTCKQQYLNTLLLMLLMVRVYMITLL